MKLKKITSIMLIVALTLSIVGCTFNESTSTETVSASNTTQTVGESSDTNSDLTSELPSTEGTVLDTSYMFTDRDIEQTPDLSDAKTLELASDTEYLIEEEGIYLISGDVENTMIKVEAADEAKVQLVLDSVSIVNEDKPAIYVKSGDKIYVTTTGSDNYLEVNDECENDGDINLDAVIFSKSDLVLNGTGTLEVISASENGITSKDDLKVTGGTIVIDASADGLEANDSIRIYDGNITVVSGKDAIHSENDDDTSLGYIYMENGTLNLTADDDAIRGTSVVQIDGGTINIETCTEGIEGTYVQINGGDITIYATDDGINAAEKSDYDVVIEIYGGDIDITMASGDTDAIDSNGDIYVYGGTINIEASSAFDINGGSAVAQLIGGDVTVNGETITDLSSISSGKGPKNK